MKRPTVRLALLVAGLSCLSACTRPQHSAAPEPSPAPAVAMQSRACGVCLAHNHQNRGASGYGTDAAAAAIERIKDFGAHAVSLTPFGFMTSVNAVEIRSAERLPGGERLQAVRREAERARARGMEVMIKPHLWIRSGWRGDIDPAEEEGGWDAWFAAYTTFIVGWAELAEQMNAEWLVVGVEFKSSSEDDVRWREVIRRVRAVYSGQITYAANWDEAENVPFWDALDAVGVQMFAPLVEEGEITVGEMQAGAERWLQRYVAVAEQADRPLILTEVGYVNRVGAVRAPYTWPNDRGARETAEGNAEQAAAYQVVLDTFGRHERVRDIYWWKVFTDLATTEEGPVGFSPIGKPAEDVLRAWCAGAEG